MEVATTNDLLAGRNDLLSDESNRDNFPVFWYQFRSDSVHATLPFGMIYPTA